MLTEGRYTTIQDYEDDAHYAYLEHEDYLASLEQINYGECAAFRENTDMQDASKTSETRVKTAKAVGATGTLDVLRFPTNPAPKHRKEDLQKGGSTKTRQGGGRAAGH
jgi:hypothetical protein